MGWFTNYVTGKSPDDANKNTSATEGSAVAPENGGDQDPYHESGGSKVIPEVVVSRVESHPSSDTKQLELWLELCNRSDFEVEVNRVDILDQTTNPGRFLKPNEKYEVRVYHGDTPREDTHQRATIRYKIIGNGDYFQSDHTILYKIETTDEIRWYLPCELRLDGQVHDL